MIFMYFGVMFYIVFYAITVLSIVPIVALAIVLLVKCNQTGPILSVTFGGVILIYSLVDCAVTYGE